MSSQPTTVTVQDLGLHLSMAFDVLFMALFDGGLVIMGITCIYLLMPNAGRKAIPHRMFWQAYTAALMFLNVGFLVGSFFWTICWIIYRSNPERYQQVSLLAFYVSNVMGGTAMVFTDGVLVWRCYMVHSAVTPQKSKLNALYWVFPLVLFVITTVAGFMAELIPPGNQDYLLTLTPLLIAFSSNFLLNLYVSLYITIRLILHRRMVLAKVGPGASTARCLRVVSILLESAALNVPIMIIAIIGLAYNLDFGNICASIGITCQSFASVLIIHQVALGRAFTSTNHDHESTTSGEEPGGPPQIQQPVKKSKKVA